MIDSDAVYSIYIEQHQGIAFSARERERYRVAARGARIARGMKARLVHFRSRRNPVVCPFYAEIHAKSCTGLPFGRQHAREPCKLAKRVRLRIYIYTCADSSLPERAEEHEEREYIEVKELLISRFRGYIPINLACLRQGEEEEEAFRAQYIVLAFDYALVHKYWHIARGMGVILNFL